MNLFAEIIISVLLVIAGIFGVIGSFGLVKLQDTMSRLHTPTKATTVGVGSVLIASMLYFWFGQGTLSWNELMITLFLLITAPISANFMAKAHLHRYHQDRKDLPPTGRKATWATFEHDEAKIKSDLIKD